MAVKKEISELRGVIVVSRAEGAILGSVSQIFVNPRSRKISALSFKKRIGGKETIVEQKNVELIGRDVVLISKEEAAQPLSPQSIAGLRSIKELQGTWVTTVEGLHLGTLVDLDVDETEWTVTELRLADGKMLPIADVKQLTIGPDQVMVPADHADKVVRPTKDAQNGFLGRVFGSESIDEVKRTISRTLKGASWLRRQAAPEKPKKDNGAADKDKEAGASKAKRTARSAP